MNWGLYVGRSLWSIVMILGFTMALKQPGPATPETWMLGAIAAAIMANSVRSDR